MNWVDKYLSSQGMPAARANEARADKGRPHSRRSEEVRDKLGKRALYDVMETLAKHEGIRSNDVPDASGVNKMFVTYSLMYLRKHMCAFRDSRHGSYSGYSLTPRGHIVLAIWRGKKMRQSWLRAQILKQKS